MKMKLYALAISLGVFATVFGFAGGPDPAYADEKLQNLKIFPPDTTKKDMKKIMKGIANALGVECDFCHNTDNMAEDTKNKEKARDMMRMVAELNKKHFGGKQKVGCITCHNGQKEPKAP